MLQLRRSLSCFSLINRQASWSCRRFASSSSGSEEIEIPNRIQRSPTDILRALSQTVGMDPTAAHYKYHDDPFLIPMSNVGKRTFAMAQESGRKSAKWIRQENSNLFQVMMAFIRFKRLLTLKLVIDSIWKWIHQSKLLYRRKCSVRRA